MKKNSRGYYRKTYTDPITGKRKEVYAKTEKELNAKMEEALAGRKEYTVEEWYTKIITVYRKDSESNRHRYAHAFSFMGMIAGKELSKVTPLDLQKCVNDVVAGHSDYVIGLVYNTIKLIFETAFQNGLIGKNPASSLRRPQGTSHQRRALTKREDELLLKALEGYRYEVFFLMMRYCGLRVGEAQDVTYEDIIYSYGKPLLHVRGTKTESADRYVPISRWLLDKIMMKAGEKTGRINVNNFGNRIGRTAYKEAWAYVLERMGEIAGEEISGLCCYELRHSYATSLIDKGVDPRIAASMLGHKDLSTLLVYSHVSLDHITALPEELYS